MGVATASGMLEGEVTATIGGESLIDWKGKVVGAERSCEMGISSCITWRLVGICRNECGQQGRRYVGSGARSSEGGAGKL